MPVDRAKWKVGYYRDSFVGWACARCGGRIALREEKPNDPETAESSEAREHGAWDPDWVHGRFAAKLTCGDCGDPAFVTGRWQVDEFWDDDEGAVLLTRYVPEYIVPAPRLITIPEAVPSSVTDELNRAFALFWLDTDACANRIRSAVERLMDEQKVPKVPSRTNRRVRLSLHQRVEQFRQRNAETADLLMAAKWIGNAGSHGREPLREDLFDAFDVVEAALASLYAPSTAAKIAKQINRKKKPRGKSAT
jgi:hypothetical protein